MYPLLQACAILKHGMLQERHQGDTLLLTEYTLLSKWSASVFGGWITATKAHKKALGVSNFGNFMHLLSSSIGDVIHPVGRCQAKHDPIC